MSRKIKTALLVLMVPLLAGTTAHARDGSLILSGAILGNGTIHSNDNIELDDKINIGAAALIEANINGFLGLESGLMVINRRYVAEYDNFDVSSEVLRLHVPIMLRFWPVDYISAGVGPYLSFKAGDRKTEYSVNDTEVASIKTSADDSVEYGLEAALTLNFAVYDKYGIFVEGRYLNPLNSESNEKSNEYLALAGFKLDL